MHTYAAIHIHVVFATWNRHAFLHREIRPDLHAYQAGIARNLGIDDVYAGGIEDHVHLLGRFSPSQSTSDLVGQIKKSSGDWIRGADSAFPMATWIRRLLGESGSRQVGPALRDASGGAPPPADISRGDRKLMR